MIMAESTAFDNIEQLTGMAEGLAAFVQQMATLGCVYTVDPKPRTAEEVVEALFRERPTRRSDDSVDPVAQHKRVWSSLTYDQGDLHVDAETEVFTWMAHEVGLRRRGAQPMVCVMDGQRSLWTSSETHLPDGMLEILDLLHVTSYLWDAAYLFHSEGSVEATAFVRDRTLRILRGRKMRSDVVCGQKVKLANMQIAWIHILPTNHVWPTSPSTPFARQSGKQYGLTTGRRRWPPRVRLTTGSFEHGVSTPRRSVSRW